MFKNICKIYKNKKISFIIKMSNIIMNETSIATPAQIKADAKAFQKFKNEKIKKENVKYKKFVQSFKNIINEKTGRKFSNKYIKDEWNKRIKLGLEKKPSTLKNIKNEWNNLSNADRYPYVDKRLKIKPIWYLSVSRRTASQCVHEYFQMLAIPVKDNDFLYNKATKRFENVSLEIQFLNTSVPLPVSILSSTDNSRQVNIKRVKQNEDDVKFIQQNIDNFEIEILRIKYDSHGKLQLFDGTEEGFNQFKDRSVESIFNRIAKLESENSKYVISIDKIEHDPSISNEGKLVAIKGYNNYIEKNNKTIDFYNDKIKEIEKINYDDINANEEIKDIAYNLVREGNNDHPFLSFNKEELVKMGAYLMQFSKDRKIRVNSDYVIITDLDDSFKYLPTDQDDMQNIIVNVKDVKKNFFINNGNYYGYFGYVVPGIENYKFNDSKSALCSFTCLALNPNFQKLLPDIIFDDRYMNFEIYKLSGIIAYRSGLIYGSVELNPKQIRICHHIISQYFNIKFCVQYSKFSVKSGRMRNDIYLYDCNKNCGIKVAKKDCGDLTIIKTLYVAQHIFNINDKESHKFLKDNIVKNIDFKKSTKYAEHINLERKSTEDYLLDQNHIWGIKVHKAYMREARINPKINHTVILNYMSRMDNEKFERVKDVNVHNKKSGEPVIFRAKMGEGNNKLKFLKYVDIDKYDELLKSYDLQLTPSGGGHCNLYVSMDLETFSKSGIKTYSFSYCVYTRGEKNPIRDEPVFKYSSSVISKDVIEEEFLKIGRRSDELGFSNVVIHFHNGSKFDSIILEPYILKFKNTYFMDGPPKAIWNPNLIDFKFNLLGINSSYSIRDSYRLLMAPVSKLSSVYNLGIENAKYEYPYCFYQKIHAEGILKTHYNKEEMIQMITEKDFPYMSKNETGIDRVKRELINYNNFVESYFKENEYFNPEEYCKKYNDQDVIIVREALLAATEMYEKLGILNGLDSLNPHKIAVYEGNVEDEKGDEHDAITAQYEVASLIDSITLSSFVGKIVRLENIYCDSKNYKTTIKNGLHDYIKPSLQGGICYAAANRKMRKFESKRIRFIAKADWFYINPKHKDLVELFCNFGYDKNKAKPTIPISKQHLNELVMMSMEEGFGLCCFDFTSLYPSAMFLQSMNAGRYRDMTENDFNKYISNKKENDKIFFASFEYNVTNCKRCNIHFLTTLDKDDIRVNIEKMPIGKITMNNIQVDLFNKLYPNGTLKFVNGIIYETTTNSLKNLIGTLFTERCKYQHMENSENKEERDMSKLEVTLKLIMNTVYGKFLVREVNNQVTYWSKNYREGIYKFAEKIIKDDIFVKMKICLRNNKICWNESLGNIIDTKIIVFLEYVNTLPVKEISKFYTLYLNAHNKNYSPKKQLIILMSTYMHKIGLFNDFFANDYDTKYERFNNKIISDHPINCPEKDNEGYTNKVKLVIEERKHENKLDWASLILAKSKELLYKLCKKIGYDQVYYIDTDSCTCDGSKALQENIKKGYKGKELGSYKSDYSNEYEKGKVYLQPINPSIGMESIFSVFVTKKLYCNVLFGLHPDGYCTVMSKKRAKGISGDHVPVQDYIAMNQDRKVKQNVTDISSFCAIKVKGGGLVQVDNLVKTAQSDRSIENEKIEEILKFMKNLFK